MKGFNTKINIHHKKEPDIEIGHDLHVEILVRMVQEVVASDLSSRV